MAQTTLFFFGADTYRSQEKLQALKKRYVDASLGDTNLVILDSTTLTSQEFVRQVQAFPFLAKTRLVVVKNLLLAGKKDLQEAALAYLDKFPETTVLCFYESGVPDKRTALFKRLAKSKFAEEFGLLSPVQIADWLAKEAEQRQLVLSPKLSQELSSAIGNDLWRLGNELDKLRDWSVANSGKITSDDLRDLVPRDQVTDVFTLITAIARGEVRRALELTEMLRAAGEAELYLLSMITYQFRTMIIVAEAFESGARSSGEIARVAGLAPFVAQKTLDLVRSQTLTKLLAQYEQILNCDAAIKTGSLPPREALEVLIVELADPNSKPAPIVLV